MHAKSAMSSVTHQILWLDSGKHAGHVLSGIQQVLHAHYTLQQDIQVKGMSMEEGT